MSRFSSKHRRYSFCSWGLS